MRRTEALELLDRGAVAWNAWAEEAKQNLQNALSTSDRSWQKRAAEKCRIDFSSHVFNREVDFSGFLFPGYTDFKHAEFSDRAFFSGAIFSDDVEFDNASFAEGASFRGVKIEKNASFDNATIEKTAFFTSASIKKASFRSAVFCPETSFAVCRFKMAPDFSHSNFGENSTFAGATFANGATFNSAVFAGRSSFHSTMLNEARFVRCEFGSSVNFSSAKLEGAEFSFAKAPSANFQGCFFDERTKFGNANLRRAKMDNFGLACMADNGGITKGMRMQMFIKDDVAELRQSFGGFKTLLHLIFLTIFAFPYVWFVASRYSEASFAEGQPVESIALWDAFCRYVVNGGLNWQTGYQPHWTFLTFIVALLFNALRVVLLRKTMQLELSQNARELPEMFSLSKEVEFWGKPMGFTWGRLVSVNDILFWIQSAAVILSTFHFLTMRIPV